MLCGCHLDDNSKYKKIPNLVWTHKPTYIANPTIYMKNHKNGMYLLESDNGIKWQEISKKPVLHRDIIGENIEFGEIAFDTSPYVIKFKGEYYYYGRLNTSLDERRIYLRKSKDLLNWDIPKKINIMNENNNLLKKNYYNFVVFEFKNVLYALTPYFEACGTTKRQCSNGKTLILKSKDGINWEIIGNFLPHLHKYKHRVNDIVFKNDKIYIFFRENILSLRQNLVSYELQLPKP